MSPAINGSCSTHDRIDAHRLLPPRFCNAFDTNQTDCERYYTPRGLCTWSGTSCITKVACSSRAVAPAGTSFVFFKFHKVGSSTVGGTVRLALISSHQNPFAACLRHSTLREKTDAERARYAYCSLCAKHDNSLVLLPYFRQPAVLSAPADERLGALFAMPEAAKVLDEHCPMRASISNLLRTGTVIRRPAERVISKYYFLRTYCAEKAVRVGKMGCAAMELDLVPWLYADSSRELSGLLRGSDVKVSCEVLSYLGDGNCSTVSVTKAKRTLDALDVVGITERMDETMVLFSERWKLPLEAIQQSYVTLLVNPTRRFINESIRQAIEAHPGVRRETELYEFALRRFQRDIGTVPNLDAKVSTLHAAAIACSLNNTCKSEATNEAAKAIEETEVE